MSVYVLGEIASAHDGDWTKAQALVRAVIDAGAHVKAQWWSDPDALADRRHVGPEYRAVYHQYQIPLDWIAAFSHKAHLAGREFVCSAFLPQDFAAIAPFCDRLKVASFECCDEALIRSALVQHQPVIISTGMASLEEAHNLWLKDWDWLEPWMDSDGALTLLHCVSAYPCDLEHANLTVLRHPWCSGFSDHTANVLTGALAVAAGARVIEAHVRLPDTDPGNPDHAPALAPSEFAEYVRLIRLAEQAMGDGAKRLQDCEKPMAQFRVTG